MKNEAGRVSTDQGKKKGGKKGAKRKHMCVFRAAGISLADLKLREWLWKAANPTSMPWSSQAFMRATAKSVPVGNGDRGVCGPWSRQGWELEGLGEDPESIPGSLAGGWRVPALLTEAGGSALLSFRDMQQRWAGPSQFVIPEKKNAQVPVNQLFQGLLRSSPWSSFKVHL